MVTVAEHLLVCSETLLEFVVEHKSLLWFRSSVLLLRGGGRPFVCRWLTLACCVRVFESMILFGVSPS
ncbi:hypothetical protein AALP_AA5G158300 [Arabis alpina]|uniref:Uncharacterized protein n=1 Tax=Arabis alpina TaxID=50452 RepID=A0A087GXD1_ARAAL|nr:hypothetical protein AALP_AA5G158300 [Arabis alpina]